MTDVRFQASDSIGLSPVAVSFDVVATKSLLDTTGDTVRLSIPRTYEITAAEVVVALSPTAAFGGGWAYKVTWRQSGRGILTEFVTVADSPTPLNYEDLPRVDPGSLAG